MICIMISLNLSLCLVCVCLCMLDGHACLCVCVMCLWVHMHLGVHVGGGQMLTPSVFLSHFPLEKFLREVLPLDLSSRLTGQRDPTHLSSPGAPPSGHTQLSLWCLTSELRSSCMSSLHCRQKFMPCTPLPGTHSDAYY